ncbi:hypothetical protein Nepgr_000507 [Nepenthes gracilis]|uniref:Uncharacterized protein n=1 Tax=Nepenthes gracilis TaxID=150966 RepID=A0AAD3RWX0_NEPGR|nr:hypothetical protein Nepgr_000507 [Nepenthes gracilis]
MKFLPPSPRTFTFRSSNLLLISTCTCVLIYVVVSLILVFTSDFYYKSLSSPVLAPTVIEHIAYGIASSQNSWPKQKDFVKLWWNPRKMRGCVFLDGLTADYSGDSSSLPPLCMSQDTSRFRYSNRKGHRSAIRVARIVSEAVNLSLPGVRWFVFGDDETVFFPENLVKTLSKYDHQLWYYIGTNSENYEQNRIFSFDMAFWGAGFAISSPLAKVLAKVLDSCLERYPHLFGSDGRIHSCLAELGVGLTREPGFHQMDIRGNAFGLLAAHPLSPLVSLHHSGHTNPLFPNMTAIKSLQRLFEAVDVDSERILQHTICYDRWFSWTISVSWGYAVEVFDYHIYLPDALQAQETFEPWKKGGVLAGAHTFNTRPVVADPCKRSTIFFFDGVSSGKNGIIKTKYRRFLHDNCTYDPKASAKKLEEIVVITKKLDLNIKQLQSPRRHCCDMLPPSADQKLEVSIRECTGEELVYMHA